MEVHSSTLCKTPHCCSRVQPSHSALARAGARRNAVINGLSGYMQNHSSRGASLLLTPPKQAPSRQHRQEAQSGQAGGGGHRVVPVTQVNLCPLPSGKSSQAALSSKKAICCSLGRPAHNSPWCCTQEVPFCCSLGRLFSLQVQDTFPKFLIQMLGLTCLTGSCWSLKFCPEELKYLTEKTGTKGEVLVGGIFSPWNF